MAKYITRYVFDLIIQSNKTITSKQISLKPCLGGAFLTSRLLSGSLALLPTMFYTPAVPSTGSSSDTILRITSDSLKMPAKIYLQEHLLNSAKLM